MERFLKKTNSNDTKDTKNTLTKSTNIDIGLDLLANNVKFSKNIFRKTKPDTNNSTNIKNTIDDNILDNSSNYIDISNNYLLDNFRELMQSKINNFDPYDIKDNYDNFLQLLWYKYVIENISNTDEYNKLSIHYNVKDN